MNTTLLAPAGNMEKLKVAVAYGADEVYFGLNQFSLRNMGTNFTLEQAETAISYLHQHGKKGLVTLNIYPFEHEYPELLKTAFALAEMGVDGVIVADLGVVHRLNADGFFAPIHISTQANTVSAQTVLAYRDLGARRVNLARELSFEQIETIQKTISNVETEVFIHGSVCFSYAGRCAISDYLTGRRANHGECTHPCRWSYQVVEKERPHAPLTVTEDERGLYLFNTTDLALYQYIQDLQRIGVNTFKIEGRNKSIHYLAATLWIYRQLMDGASLPQYEVSGWLSKVMNRGYSTGFMKGAITPDDYRFEKSDSIGTAKFVGVVESCTPNGTVVDVRNKIVGGQTLEVLAPGGQHQTLYLPDLLKTTDGVGAQAVTHGKKLLLEERLAPYAILRQIDNGDIPDRG